MSDVRVSVDYKAPAVFAGEEIQCTITFRNIASTASLRTRSVRGPGTGSTTTARDRWKEVLPLRNPTPANDTSITGSHLSSPASSHPTRGHKPTNFVSHPVGARRVHSVASSKEILGPHAIERHGHKKAISIVSLGKALPRGDIHESHGQRNVAPRSGRGHSRAASMQVLPWRNDAGSSVSVSGEGTGVERTIISSDRITTGLVNVQSTRPVPPLVRSSTYTADQREYSKSGVSASSPVGSTSIGLELKESVSITDLGITPYPSVSDFAAPQESRRDKQHRDTFQTARQSSIPSSSQPNVSNSITESYNPISKAFSNIIENETPRSSGEFFSFSNNSSDTLASEYIDQEPTRIPLSPLHSRQKSLLDPPPKAKGPEKLMMGYVQLSGGFSLDGSLVNKSVFDETRRKGIVGDQGGGGLVREDAGKRESGFFGSLGWGNIGAPLEGFLGANELSSIKGSKESDKNIPILSTPQSILFVDLQLGPGESRSFEYSHMLPTGIPPSHRGKAVKVMYHLVIGTQRYVASAHKHHVQHVNIPFRVLPGVNCKPRNTALQHEFTLIIQAHGELLGHDLMLPYILLHNTANISIPKNTVPKFPATNTLSSSKQNKGSEQDFLSYIRETFSRSQQSSDQSLLSPTETGYDFLFANVEEPKSTKEAIELVMLRGTKIPSAKRNATRFDIAKEGARVAIITLSRTSYRLGDLVYASIDFSGADVPCYSLHATLESCEVVDTSVALRSSSSIQRITRQIHASQGITTICARKVSFSPVIPVASTPSFLTSAIDNNWDLRFEFVTSKHVEDANDDEDGMVELLQEVARDERAAVSTAVHTLSCDAFDVSIPLTVYGATQALDERMNVQDLPI